MATFTKRGFRLTGADGGPLRGDVRTAGGARPAVVICHGFKGFKDWGFFPHVAERLARAGFTAVSFNFSSSGVGANSETFDELERFARHTYSNDLRDLEIVLGAVGGGELGFAPSALGLFGHSMGGAIALLQAARDESAGALVTWAAVARFGGLWRADQVAEWRRTGKLEIVNQRTGQLLPLYPDILDDLEAHGDSILDLERAAGALRVPWLIVHGAADESVPVAAGHALYQAARPGTAELMLVEGAGHTFSVKHPWNGASPELERAVQAAVSWFGRHLV